MWSVFPHEDVNWFLFDESIVGESICHSLSAKNSFFGGIV